MYVMVSISFGSDAVYKMIDMIAQMWVIETITIYG